MTTLSKDPEIPARRNTRWTHGGDGFYRLFRGTLQYCPEAHDGTMEPSEACDCNGNEYEAEAIAQIERMNAILRDPAQPEGPDGTPLAFPALDDFDAILLDPKRATEVLSLIWFQMEADEWGADTLDRIAHHIHFDYDVCKSADLAPEPSREDFHSDL